MHVTSPIKYSKPEHMLRFATAVYKFPSQVRQTNISGSMSNNVLASASFSRRNWHGAPEWIKDDGFLSIRGRQFHQRWIHQALAYVARFPLQAHLQGTAALLASLRYLVHALSPRLHYRAKKVDIPMF